MLRSVLVVAVCLALVGCTGRAAPTPTADPFSTVAQQADQAYQQGMELYQQGRRVEALDAFQRARLLSPTDDQRIDAMVQQLSAELTPTLTPAPPTPTAVPQPTQVVENTATPSAALGDDYFGQVFLTIAPGSNDTLPPAMTEFSRQDQIALYIEHLDQRLRLAFELRIFDAGSAKLLVDASSTHQDLPRFQNKFVWYQTGGEAPGSYHAELYAGDVLTHTFDYVVGENPVAIPTSTPVPTLAPQPAPMVVEEPTAAPPAPAPAPPVPVPQPAPAPRPAPAPVVAPPARAPAEASIIGVPGHPTAFDVMRATDQLYVADQTGLVWVLDHGRPTLRRPLSVQGEPIGLAADQTNGRLYVASGSQPSVTMLDTASGQQVASIALPADPGDVQLDSSTGLLFVVIPQTSGIATIDVRSAKIVRLTDGLDQVTGMALDKDAHVLYVSQLDGIVAAIDEASGQITSRVQLTDVGLTSIASRQGWIYAVNTPGRELVAFDLTTGDANHIQLNFDPLAITVGEQTGSAYVLAPESIVHLDPPAGSELSRVALGAVQLQPTLDADHLWTRPRLALNPADEAVYVLDRASDVLALAPPGI